MTREKSSILKARQKKMEKVEFKEKGAYYFPKHYLDSMLFGLRN